MIKIWLAMIPFYLYAAITIHFPIVTKKNTPKAKAALYFAKKVKEISKGKMVVKVEIDSKNSDNQMLNILNDSKDIQMLAPALNKFATYMPKLDFFNTPFLFKDIYEIHKLFDPSYNKNILNDFKNNGFILLGVWDNGFTQLTSNKLILSSYDFNNTRVRVYSSKIAVNYMHSHGAIPINLPFHYLYIALKKSLIDTQINTLSNIYTTKAYTLQNYLIMLNYNYLGYGVVVNKSFWNKLSVNQKNIIKQAFKEATQKERIWAIVYETLMLKKLKEYAKTHNFKIITLSAKQKELFTKDALLRGGGEIFSSKDK